MTRAACESPPDSAFSGPALETRPVLADKLKAAEATEPFDARRSFRQGKSHRPAPLDPDRRSRLGFCSRLSGVEDLRLATDDGEMLVAWHLPPRNGHPLILYFHGNGGALVDRVPPVPTVLSQNVVAVAAQAGTFVPHL